MADPSPIREDVDLDRRVALDETRCDAGLDGCDQLLAIELDRQFCDPIAVPIVQYIVTREAMR